MTWSRSVAQPALGIATVFLAWPPKCQVHNCVTGPGVLALSADLPIFYTLSDESPQESPRVPLANLRGSCLPYLIAFW